MSRDWIKQNILTMPDHGYVEVVGTFPLLRISLQYSQGPAKARLIALFGLLARLEDCFTRASDPSVSRSKLGWWYEELGHARTTRPHHPLTSSLVDSGALALWSPGLLDRLFQQSFHRIDHPGLNDEKELRTLCQSIGSIHLELEASLCDETPGAIVEEEEGVGIAGFMQILRETYLAKLPTYYWIPLANTAETGLTRSQIGDLRAGKKACEVMAGLFELPIRWLNDERQKAANPGHADSTRVASCPHWQIHSAMQQRQLWRLQRKLRGRAVPGAIASEMLDVRVGDGWAAWRMARKIGLEKMTLRKETRA